MPYERKTVDVFEVQGDYGQGWECVYGSYDRKDARARLAEYRENDPKHSYKLVKVREKK